LELHSENTDDLLANTAITTSKAAGKAGSVLEKPSAKYSTVFIEKHALPCLNFSHYKQVRSVLNTGDAPIVLCNSFG
jgi:hypothetical protein